MLVLCLAELKKNQPSFLSTFKNLKLIFKLIFKFSKNTEYFYLLKVGRSNSTSRIFCIQTVAVREASSSFPLKIGCTSLKSLKILVMGKKVIFKN